MHDMLHVPNLHSNLLMVSILILRDLKVHLNLLGCVVRTRNGVLLDVASLKSNWYQLDMNVMNGAETNCLAHSDGK
jgi:hypothetical protein